MKNLVFILLNLLIWEVNLPAQNWIWGQSTTGSIYSDEGLCVAADGSGNSFLGGEFVSPVISFGSITLTNSSNCGIAFITKYDGNGNPVLAEVIL